MGAMAVRLADQFTSEEISQMHREMRGGATIEEVAARHGIPQCAVDQFKRGKEKKVRERGAPWTQPEIDYLIENYRGHDRNWSGWKRLGRSWRAIYYQAGKLGLSRQYRNAWDDDEIAFLKANYGIHPIDWSGWSSLGRSKRAIISMARRKGLSKPVNVWTEIEKQFVRENYPVHGSDWDGWKWMDRTWRAISSVASKMNVKRQREGVQV